MNIKVENLNLNYGNHTALEDVSFELNENKIYGLLGRNGAGKTSLLSILASFNKPSKGAITVDGEDPFENANIMQHITFLYDKSYKNEAEDIINFLEGIERYRPNFDMSYAEELIEKFKLQKKKPIKEFSKGMQSALNVIIGLASRTPVTIFDEVYLGMDAPSRDIFYKELLKDQQDYPRMMILSTHLVSEMEYLFDEVILLNKGKVLLQEDFHSLISKGASITGNTEIVDDFVKNMRQINVKQLGGMKSVTIYGELHDDQKQAAVDKGLDVSPISLHDLFVHLTEEENE
ncbi:ATP-binding cassette domain-containing protein [Piscibacillus halophilus]|uniref:ABC-2 type transport system ATP-binding protein n=1 Tax=Piscibacillus halophilus TaxID=571933 RepID=A0A1H9CXF0_9BACI|nr:ABC transporter ATP-binding protein [Piscibacillus halophilus]SEQ05819.1 ABC-2 type transport system ATP-binding protein [Piscibacillus halophilus]